MPNIIECGDETNHISGPIKFLIYGSTGAGKSYSLLTLPDDMLPALVLDADRGARVLWGKKDFGTCVTFDVEDAQGKPTLYTQMRDFVMETRKKHSYKTVVCDSFTTVHMGISEFIMDKNIGSADKQGRVTRDSIDAPPAMREWGDIAHLSMKFLQSMIQLGTNLICICHEARLQPDDVTGLSKAVMALQPAIAKSFPRYFDEVLYAKASGTDSSNLKYVWNTKATGLFEARTRHPELAAEIPQDFGAYVT